MARMNRPDSLAVLLPNWVGDAVMATPTLRSLRRALPDTRILFAGRSAPLAVLAGSDWADQAVTLGQGFFADRAALRKAKPELAVLMPNSFRSAVLAWAGGAKRRVGYTRDGRSLLLTDRLKPPRDANGHYMPTPMIEYYAQLLAPLDIPLDSPQMQLPVSDADRSAAEALLADSRATDAPLRVLFNPSAAFGTSKNWPADRYATLGDRLIEQYQAAVIINAAPNDTEQAIAREVARRMSHPPVVNLADRDNSLGLLKGLASRCELVVTNDTGARHIAAACGAGVVTIFGSTDPSWTTLNYPRERIVRTEVACAPCQEKFCPHPTGPEHHVCMTSIPVDAVWAAVEDLLNNRRGDS